MWKRFGNRDLGAWLGNWYSLESEIRMGKQYSSRSMRLRN